MRYILLVILLGTFSICFSQQYLKDEVDTNSYKQVFLLNGIGQYSGNAIQNEMVNKLLLGGDITTSSIQNSLDNHREVNRFGFDASLQFQYQNFTHLIGKKKKYGFLVNLESSFLGGMMYSKDMFQLVFDGNTNLENNSADLSGTKFYSLGFQKIGLGFISPKSKSSISLNYYNISNYIQADVSTFGLEQSAGFSQIDVETQLEYNRTTGDRFDKGYGFGVDVDIRFPVQMPEGKSMTFQVLGKNLGFAQLYSNVESYTIDTSYSYQGLTFNQLYGEGTIFTDDFEVLDTLGITPNNNKKSILLPGFIQIAKMTENQTENRLQSYFGVRIYNLKEYAPLMFIGAQYNLYKNYNVASHFTVGGFGRPRASVILNAHFPKFNIGLSTNDIYGLVARKGLGKSLLIQMRCAI
ncbi:hypothetical protein N9E20_02615 [Crocinitomicaceae bacterium]|nr:hypothetical protein [Crocinitomicaceae bacterium]